MSAQHAPTRAFRGARCEGGFVLPVALVVLVLLALISATGLYVARSDYRAAEATRQAAVALAAADAGASRTVAVWVQVVPSLPVPGDSLVLAWESLPDGSQYRSVVVRAPVGAGESPSSKVLLRTTGIAAPPAAARRTVVTVVDVGGGPLCCSAAAKVNTTLEVTGPRRDDGVVEVDGQDRAPPGWAALCAAPTSNLPGVVSADTSRVDLIDTGTIGGTPPVVQDATVDPLDFTDFGSTTYNDLAALADASFATNQTLRNRVGPVVAGGQCVTGNRLNWGSPWTPAGPCGSYFPVIHVAGNLTLQGSGQGQGILLVDGNLTIQDDFQFYGVVIVLGVLRLRGPGSLFGGVMARGGPGGLGRSEVRNRGRILYSGCAVQRALSALPTSATGGGGASAQEYSWFESIG